jgi:hypothetical protein
MRRIAMSPKIPKTISALEFGCQAPLRFYEHCTSCPRFSDSCPDLALGKEILRGKKNIAYRNRALENEIPATAFNCLAPLYYFEKSRVNCGHLGRCREEGLLLALLDGKKKIDYSRKAISELPRIRRPRVSKVAKSGKRKAVAS